MNKIDHNMKFSDTNSAVLPQMWVCRANGNLHDCIGLAVAHPFARLQFNGRPLSYQTF